MIVCSNCGNEVQSDERVCPQCGQPIEAQDNTTAEMEVVNMPSAEPEEQNGSSAGEAEPKTTLVGRLMVRPVSPISGGQFREFALDGRPIYIGRSPSCDIVLDGDQLTSRRHVLLRYDNNGYVLVDLGSSNGTYVNDTEVREATPLRDGDRIVIGEHELFYSTAAASSEASLPGVEQPPVPSQPLSETNPSLIVAASIADRSAPSAPVAVAVVDYAADVEEEPATEEHPAVRMGAEPAEEPAGAAPQLDEMAAWPAMAEEPAVSGVPAMQGTMAADAGEQSVGDPEMETMYAQLAQLTAASEALARRMEEQARVGERRRAAVQEARDRVNALLAQLDQEQGGAEGESTPRDLSGLLGVVRQAAENPHHLPYVTRLAEHAGELADVLEQEQQQPESAATSVSIRQALEALRDRLEGLA
jgi:pSer/pThr/pTyr-binding forkhead associated (FHA) protein